MTNSKGITCPICHGMMYLDHSRLFYTCSGPNVFCQYSSLFSAAASACDDFVTTYVNSRDHAIVIQYAQYALDALTAAITATLSTAASTKEPHTP